MKSGGIVKVTVSRYDPERDAKPRYQTYSIPYKENLTVLGALRYIYERLDGSLAFNYECRFGRCGTCAVNVNRRPVLACKTLAEEEMLIEPLSNFPIIRDLVIDRSAFEWTITRIRPFLERIRPPKEEPEKLLPDSFEAYIISSRCVRCYSCLSVCPIVTYSWDNYSGPATMVEISKFMFDPRDCGDRAMTAYSEGIYNCVNCMRCTNVCPHDIPVLDIITDMRSELFNKDYYPLGIRRVVSGIEATGNIYGMEADDRNFWMISMDDIISRRISKKAKIAYYVGCVSASSGRLTSIPQSFVRIMERFGLDYTVLGPDEECCGNPLILSGDLKNAKRLAEYNVESLENLNIEEVVFSCPGCYKIFKSEYPKLLNRDLPFNLLHATEFLARLVKERELNFEAILEKSVTYHDPCDLGRHVGVIKEPRMILKSIPGLTLKELPEKEENCVCCGGGGMVMASNPELSLKLSQRKVDNAKALNVEAIISACPACKLNIMNGINASGEKLEVLDVIEVAFKALNSTHI